MSKSPLRPFISPSAPLLPISPHTFGSPFAGTRLKPAPKSDRTNALYIGCLFYCFRAAAGLCEEKAKVIVGMRSYPHMTGEHHIHRTRGHMRVIEAFRTHAPDLFAVQGVGDYLMAYVRYEPYTHLYNPEIMAIAQLKHVQSPEKAAKLRALFDLKEPPESTTDTKLDPNDDAYAMPTLPVVSPAKMGREDDVIEHTAHNWLANDTSPNPIQPQSPEEAIAQERLLNAPKGRHLWDDLTQRERLKLVADNAQKLPKVPYEKLWAGCASALLKKANKAAHQEIQTLSADAQTARLYEELHKTLHAENAPLRGSNLLRRITYLTAYAPCK